MESTGERETPERKIGPTVSKDKWLNHAKTKLARGYVLIVGTQRKTANFHSQEKGYEMCAYNVARQLIKDGIVKKVREHHLGDVYELAEVPAIERRAAPRPEPSPDEEFDILLKQIEDGSKDESQSAPVA